ncbi:MAG: DUF1624 domain-containing protein [Oscillospiraceae bacterium]|nr:DUF1624 domain-containing protein [Oscillospiraceae bacterium]
MSGNAEKGRIPLLDALRGLSILLMVAYHAGYNLAAREYIPDTVLYNPFMGALVVLFAGLFIVLAGVSSRFSRSNLRRALVTLGCAALVTAVSCAILPAPWLALKAAYSLPVEEAEVGRLVLERRLPLSEKAQTALGRLDLPAEPDPEAAAGKAVLQSYRRPNDLLGTPVTIGILHLLGACMLIYWLLEKLTRRLKLPPGDMTVIAGVPLIAVFLSVYYRPGASGFWPDIPSADWFPIVPWGLLFLLGAMLGGPIREGRLPEWFYRFNMPFLPSVGRRTLIIYLAHQPVLYGALFLLERL